MKKTYNVKDIDCASCALKIEEALNQFEGIENARVDFAKSKIYMNSDENIHLDQINKIAKKVHSDTIVYEINDEIDEPFKIHYVLGFIGILLLVLTYVFTLNSMINQIVLISSYLLVSYKIIFKALKQMLQKNVFDEHVLMMIATIGALLLHEYVEAIAVMVFYQVGEYFQSVAVIKSRKNIESLLDLKPKIAHLLDGDTLLDCHPEEVNVGDLLRVKPGEQIPTDAILIEGNTTFDYQSITGESMPIESKINQEIPAGVMNLTAAITIKVKNKFMDSSLQKMIDFVESESGKKAKAEQFMTRFAKYYTPIVVLLAFILAFVIPIFTQYFNDGSYLSEFSIYSKRALIFLVISCPCALVLSIPLSFYAGIGLSSKKGFLVKSGSDLEMIKQIDHFVFDKTGTLTKGNFSIIEIKRLDEKEDVLHLAALLESQSNHPIAQSIVAAYKKSLDTKVLKNVKEHLAKGITATIDNDLIAVGNDKLLQALSITTNKIQSQGLVIYVAKNKKVIGYIVLADTLKENSYQLIQYLQHIGKEVSMVSGDQQSVSENVANALNINHVYAEQTPSDKASIIHKLCEHEKVAFIGDGINDAMVLISADLGISMGALGSDIAIEASDVVIVNDDPYLIKDAIETSNYTHINVMQNISLALGIKAIVLILGALGYAHMWMAIFADVGVSLIAVLNAMRLLYKK